MAHAGQTLVSIATAQLVRDQLASGVVLRDLSAHRLKDIQHPERIFQVVADGFPAHFPPLRSRDARPHNLPAQRDPLIEREDEVAEASRLLRQPEIGLVTLTGSGDTDKTRLALAVAAELADGA